MSHRKRKSDSTGINNNVSQTKIAKKDLQQKLMAMGINVPATFTKSQMESLISENSKISDNSNNVSVAIDSPNAISSADNNGYIPNNDIREILSTVKSLGETVKRHSAILERIPFDNSISVSPVTTSVPLELPTDSGNMASSKATAGMFPHLHLVTPTQRQTIIEGKYINLASLLVPPSDNYDIRQIEADGTVITVKAKDARLQRDLSLQEFIEAFNMFKNIICGIEDRRVELDNYLQDIIDMAVKFKGNTFYEYHKAFAKKAAAIKQIKGLTIDWAVRDEKLYNTICLGKPIHTCSHCGSSLHISEMCPSGSYSPVANSAVSSQFKRSSNSKSDTDIYGRPKLFYAGKEVCNHFLAGSCARSNWCRFAHVQVGQSSNKTQNQFQGQVSNIPTKVTKNQITK